uniref:NADP-dependent oxidoreductase domain-containing protein n=1 Tax=Proboscia inermis TaxID=420281 RepID=A0A6T8L0Y4_9STRA|mmetsp:Transcript_35130/g.35339  ORF Transcript_35130/g.35339 Transcript_35130/m.35339 type:complete len:413 (+) Transcript_35130:64-1302(+)
MILLPHHRMNAFAIALLLESFFGGVECFSSTKSLPMLSESSLTILHMSVNDEEIKKHLCLDRRSTFVSVGSLMATTTGLLFSASPAFSSTSSQASDIANGSPSVTSSSVAASIPEWTLQGGVKFPTLALNTVGLSVEETTRAVSIARKNGITHIDFHPGKERDGVAKYIASSSRDGLFLTTKIRKAPQGTSPEEAAKRAKDQIDEDLKALGVSSVDMLMLRDSPDPRVIQSQWAVLEEALASGKTKSIGVINFCESALKAVLKTAKVKPALNYYMLHVGMGPDAHGLRSFGEAQGIRTFAYGAVGEPGPSEELLLSPILEKIGDAYRRSTEEVALRWLLQSGVAVSVRPTTNFDLGISSCEGALCEVELEKRSQIFGWTLSKKEMKKISAMTSPDGNPTLFSSSGCPNAFVR